MSIIILVKKEIVKQNFLLLMFLLISSCNINNSPKLFGLFPNQPKIPPIIKFTKPASLIVSESGTSIQIQFSINKEPLADVKIEPILSNENEIILDKPFIEFKKTEWQKIQILTITGKDDFIVDGTKNTEISFTKILSADLEFTVLKLDTITVSTTDNDDHGLVVTPTSGLVTNESGATTSFTVFLTSEPKANVTLPLISSSNTNEGTVSPSSLTFTPNNWNIAQTVTIKGVDDLIDDGSQTYSIDFNPTTSDDPLYLGKTTNPISIVNGDDEGGSGITVGMPCCNTTEAGGTTTFNIVLNTNPGTNVTVSLSSNNNREGTVSPSSVSFNSTNWNIPVIITVTGVDDFVQDGNINYTINVGSTTSLNLDYNGLTTQTVAIINNDNDTAGYTINLVNSYLVVSDGGEIQSTIQVNLNSQPTTNVTIPITSSDTGEANPNVAGITFTPTNWNTIQNIVISGVDDGDPIDGNKTFTISLGLPTTTDTVYAAIDPNDQAGTSCNNNSVAAKISVCRATPNSNTSEDLATNEFYLIANQLPTANVTVNVLSGDTTEGTVSPASIIINTSNWNQLLASNRVLITGVNDSFYDGNINYNINFTAASSADLYFHGYVASAYGLTNIDNENYFTVSTTSITTTEGSGIQTFTVELPTAPTANVTIPISSSNTAEGIISPASLTFTMGNWNMAQTVTITPINDSVADGNITYTVDLGLATSGDARFNNKDPANVAVTNNDAGEKRIFLTNSTYNGNLGGKAGADTKCNSDSNRPSILPNTYKAMLAVTSSRTGSPVADWVFAASSRIFQSDGITPIMTTDAGAVFTFGALTNPFANNPFWSGLTNTWTASANTCAGWTSSSNVINGVFGDGISTNAMSINNSTLTCDQQRRILCVQQ